MANVRVGLWRRSTQVDGDVPGCDGLEISDGSASSVIKSQGHAVNFRGIRRVKTLSGVFTVG